MLPEKRVQQESQVQQVSPEIPALPELLVREEILVIQDRPVHPVHQEKIPRYRGHLVHKEK